jgi:hypothetical protein
MRVFCVIGLGVLAATVCTTSANADTLTASASESNRAAACSAARRNAQSMVSGTYSGRMEVYDLSACECSEHGVSWEQWTCTTTAYFRPRNQTVDSPPPRYREPTSRPPAPRPPPPRYYPPPSPPQPIFRPPPVIRPGLP